MGPSTSHLLHLVLSIFTLGWWVPVWVVLSIRHEFEKECIECDQDKANEMVDRSWDNESRFYKAGKSLARVKRYIKELIC